MKQIIKIQNITVQSQRINLSNYQLTSNHLSYVLTRGIYKQFKQPPFFKPKEINYICLSNNKIGDEGLKDFIHCKWISLTKLELQKNYITMKGIENLSQAAEINCFPQLKILILSDNQIGSYNYFALKDEKFEQKQKKKEGLLLKFSNQNTKLQALSLASNNINDQDMKRLFNFNSKNQKKIKKNLFQHLKSLRLQENKIKDKGLYFLSCQNIQYSALVELFLWGNQINKNGVKYLASSKNENAFKSLKKLQLSFNPYIGDQGIKQFFKGYVQTNSFLSLQELFIKKSNFTNKGVEYLIKHYDPSKCIKKLKRLCFSSEEMIINTKEVKNKLEMRFQKGVEIDFPYYF